jgi:hypothetical protein
MMSIEERERAAGLRLAGNDTMSGRKGNLTRVKGAEETAGRGTFGTKGKLASKGTFGTKGRLAGEPKPQRDSEDMIETVEVRRSGGGGGAALWDVSSLNAELNPLTLVAEVLEETLSAWEAAFPTEAQIDGIISSIFDSITRTSTEPSSVAASIEALFSGLTLILDTIESGIETKLNNINPISTALSVFFENLEKFPKDGDYIYNDTLGIAYIIFEKKEEVPAGRANPTANLIFRVVFDVVLNEGEPSELTRTFVAMTLIPAPDIAKLVKMILTYLIGFIQKVLSAGLSSIVTNVAGGIIGGLTELYEELLALIEAIEIPSFDPTYLENLISALDDALNTLTDRVNVIETAQDALQTALDAIQADIDEAVDVHVIGADGNKHTVKVMTDTTGASLEREITWIESDTGYGRKASFIVKEGAADPLANTTDVDWRQINYIHPNGRTYQMHCLVRIADAVTGFPGYIGSEPIDNESTNNFVIKEIVLCENGSPVDSRALFMDGSGSVPSENGTDPDYYTPPA